MKRWWIGLVIGIAIGAAVMITLLGSSTRPAAFAQVPARDVGRWQLMQARYVEETKGTSRPVERLLLLDTATGDVYRYQYYVDDKGEAIGWYYMGERKR